ncbi:Sushi domain-containing protein 4, partial [Varanus komodoensis]
MVGQIQPTGPRRNMDRPYILEWSVYQRDEQDRKLIFNVCMKPSDNESFDELHACADPGFPEYGYKMPSTGVFFESSVVRFHCQEGYRLKGPSKKLCERHFNGSLSWKPSEKPVCLQE